MPGERSAAPAGPSGRRRDFNGAPDRCPGRGPRPRPPRPAPDTSMEPRTDARGESASQATAVLARTVQLQWSPGQMPGERSRGPWSASARRNFNGAPDRCPGRADGHGTRATPARRTSMEPRTDARGEARARIEGEPRAATSMEPRTDARGELRERAAGEHADERLQWSPGQMPGESGVGAQVRARVVLTSMEPRTDARGESVRRRSPPPPKANFNGAPDRCPGRVYALRNPGLAGSTSMEPRTDARGERRQS